MRAMILAVLFSAGAAGAAEAPLQISEDCAGARVPNRLAVVERTAKENPAAWSGKLNPDEKSCRADSRFLDKVVENLRRESKRWGFNCKRGDCGNPSHDVIAYYFGPGEPYEGAPQVMLVDMIVSSCDRSARPGWLVLDFSPYGAGWTGKGIFSSGPRQNIVMNCPKGGARTSIPRLKPVKGLDRQGGPQPGGNIVQPVPISQQVQRDPEPQRQADPRAPQRQAAPAQRQAEAPAHEGAPAGQEEDDWRRSQETTTEHTGE